MGSSVAQYDGDQRLIPTVYTLPKKKSSCVWLAYFSIDIDAPVSGPFSAAHKCHDIHMKIPLHGLGHSVLKLQIHFLNLLKTC